MKKLIIVLGVIFFLRLPTLAEPYWYGDEAIYLAIGQVLQKGGVLYRDVWDNKTPILYLIYAIDPVLWWAKLAATLAVLGAVVGSFFLAKKINKKCAALTALGVGVCLSLPSLEGTIANAELFFIVPIVFGAYVIFSGKRLWLAGPLAAVAFLIKVPAIFDFFGLFLYFLIVKKSLKDFVPISVGFLAPICLFGIYFAANGAFFDAVNAAFSQNASYVAVGSGSFEKLSNPLFVKGIILIISSLVLVVGFIKKYISKELLFLSLWFAWSLFGALISNRLYMHYLLQIVPATIILGAYLTINIKKYFAGLVVLVVILFVLFQQFNRAFHLHSLAYFKNFYDYASERKTTDDYVTFFDKNALIIKNVADFVRNNTNSKDKIFVWGDAANIYVLSERLPATKFIQAHHLTTVPAENYDLLITKLQMDPPKLILIESGSRFGFPKLTKFVEENYEPPFLIEDMAVYRLKVT